MKALGIVGASGALLAVMLGALGAHGLKTVLGESALHAFNTAVEYQMYHSLAVLLVCALPGLSARVAAAAAWCFVAGTVLFSGSIYGLTMAGLSWLGPVTPLGGLTMMAGWFLLIVSMIKGR